MGIVRTIKGEDGKPYISLEDLIKEVKDAKLQESFEVNTNDPRFVEVFLKTLINMEIEYYDKYLFKRKK